MNVTCHLAVATSTFLVAIKAFPHFTLFQSPLFFFIGLFACLFGSLLPDLDHPRSTMGKCVPFISYPISGFFGHRGITHSLLAVVGLCWVLKHYVFAQEGTTLFFVLIVFPLVLGYLSHLIADVFSYAGVPLFYPLRIKVSIPIFRSGPAQVVLSMTFLAFSI